MKISRLFALTLLPMLLVVPMAMMQAATEAPAGFDNLTNGRNSQLTHDGNLDVFEEQEGIVDGLGPVFNAKACGNCHLGPVTGGSASIVELRAGHFDGTNFISHPGDSLIHTNAIDAAIQEQVLDGNEVRAGRVSLNTLGDGFVEAINSNTLIAISNAQAAAVRGTVIEVPVVEAGGVPRVGRFGHKDQHASLESFSGDAYLNEMGITNCVDADCETFGHENTSNGNSVAAFDTVADPEDDGDDVERFTEFMRTTKVPPRGPINAAVTAGQNSFNAVGCGACHVNTITTSAVGTIINGGELVTDNALGNKIIHPFGDFLLHNVGTGDGIVQNGGQATRNQIRTMPLWGLRTRNRLMHDGVTVTVLDAINRHAGQATTARNNFNAAAAATRANILAFLRSL